MERMTRLSALPAALLVILLAGCVTPIAPSEPGDPSLGSRPTPRTTATCDELAPAGSFDAFFTAPLDLVGAERTEERLGNVFSDAWATREAGGLACEWQDATSVVDEHGSSLEFQGVQLRLLPASVELWHEFVGADEGDRVQVCAVVFCRLDVFSANGWWLSLDASRLPVESEARVTNAFDVIAERVAALPAPTAVDPPRSGDAIATTCGDQVAPHRVALAAGTAHAVGLQEPIGTLGDAALAATGGTACTWESDQRAFIAEITVLPGGAWAATEAARAHGATTEVVVRGHESPALERRDGSTLTLDLTIDGDWVRIDVVDDDHLGVAPKDVAMGIAIALVHAAAG